MNIDPKGLTYQEKSIVDLMNEQIADDGHIIDNNQSSNVAWVLYALEVLSSDKVEIVANKMVENRNDDNGYWNEDFYNPGTKLSSTDTTGWAIEALTLAGNYNEAIEDALVYLNNSQDENTAEWSDGWSDLSTVDNADTQSCVLTGLLAYNKDKVVNGDYDKSGNDPFGAILRSQIDNGSFEAYYNPGVYNQYTTGEVARCLGTYKNGSVILRAKNTYNNLGKDITPVSPNTPTSQEVNSVKTGDQNNIMLFISLSFISGALLLVLTKKYARYN